MGTSPCKCDEPVLEVEQKSAEHIFQVPLVMEEDVRLTIAIAGARGLRDLQWMEAGGRKSLKQRAGCRCTVEVPMRRHSVRFRTSAAHDALAPVPIWKTELPIADYIDGSSLHFTVTDEGGVGAVLGRARLEASQFSERGFNGELALSGGKSRDAFLKVKVRNAGQEYPPGPPSQFTVFVEKKAPDQSIGLELDIQDSTFAYVLDIGPGPIREYNETAPPETQVQPGDFIEKVNGVKGLPSMLEVMKTAREQAITVRRPEEYSAMLLRAHHHQPLGLTFPERILGRTLPIVDITKGAVQEWNDVHEDFQLKVGDRITMVDGEPGEAQDFMDKMTVAPKVVLTLVRPAAAGQQSSWKFW